MHDDSNEKASRNKTTKVGLVTSSGADKSVVVKVENLVMHPLYQKFIRTSPSSWRTTKKTPVTKAIACSSKSAGRFQSANAGVSARSSSGRSSGEA